VISRAISFASGAVCGGTAMAIVAAFWAYDRWWSYDK
jgi:hypothetical protein